MMKSRRPNKVLDELEFEARLSRPRLKLGTVSIQVLPSTSSPILALDRQWVLPLATEQRAYAMPVLPPLKEAATALGILVQGSLPLQLSIKAAAVAVDQQRRRFDRWKVQVSMVGVQLIPENV